MNKVSEDQTREIFKSVSAGELTKEAIPDVVIWLSGHEDKSVQEAINDLGLKVISENELKTFVEKLIVDNKRLIQERGEGSFGILMGVIMRSLRGRVDAAIVSKVLKERLKEILK
jgi:glutamyl-tRNA(Gln) amidotransferase subunit E